MKILHVCDGLPSAHSPGGGHVFFWQNLAALSELGHEVHLVVCNTTDSVEEDVARRVSSVAYAIPVRPGKRSLDYWLSRVFREETLLFRLKDWLGLESQVAAAVKRVKPDLIWADHMFSLAMIPSGVPTVYGHLDFIHQLQPVRQAARTKRLRRPDAVSLAELRRIELALCKRAQFAVSVSNTDLQIFGSLGVPAMYMPVVGEPIPAPGPPPDGPVRAFLLGRSNTAMNMSRKNLRDEIWPHLDHKELNLEWHQVGEPPTKPDDSWRWVEQNFVVHGYQRDLRAILRPGDLCLVPYRDDTGFRAKFVTAAGYGMVNVGYDETYQCAPEFVPGQNCLAARTGKDLATLLATYASDSTLRKRYSESSRSLYEQRFGLSSHLPSYASILERVLQ